MDDIKPSIYTVFKTKTNIDDNDKSDCQNNNIGLTSKSGGTGATKAITRNPSTSMEKVVAKAFTDLVQSFQKTNCNSIYNNTAQQHSIDSDDSDDDNFDVKSKCSSSSSGGSSKYSFESLFNGSTYYLDDYFTSIGFDGSTVISGLSGNTTVNSTTDSTNHIDSNHTENCISPKYNTNDDVESVYTSSSSSKSSSSSSSVTLDGLKILTGITNEDDIATPSPTCTCDTIASDAQSEHIKTKSLSTKNYVDCKKFTSKPLPGTSSLLKNERMSLLEKIFVLLSILVILAGCAVTAFTIVRHFKYKNATTTDSSKPNISSTNNQPPLPTTNISTTNKIDTNVSRDERMYLLRSWLGGNGSDFNPSPGTPQYNALHWMAFTDVPSILGNDIAKRSMSTNGMYQNASLNNIFSWNDRLLTLITQRYVLLLVFFANIGDANLVLGGWASISGARLTECIWPGITCRTIVEPTDNSSVSVITGIELNPSIAKVHGSLPTELGLLTNLETLILTDNTLTGAIPSNLYLLEKLYAIRISNTTISSNISSGIGKLTNIKFLDLSMNYFHSTLPTELGLLVDLQYLNVAQNNFNGTIPSELSQLDLLQQFSIECNDFVGTMPTSFCSLRYMHRLQRMSANCILPFVQQNEPQYHCAPIINRIVCDCCTICY